MGVTRDNVMRRRLCSLRPFEREGGQCPRSPASLNYSFYM